MILLQLFLSFLQIGLFSIGGGYAAIPLIQSQTVDVHQWLTSEQFMDLATIAEMTPGPIAINGATFSRTFIRRATPPIRISPPSTIPPPSTRSNSLIRVGIRRVVSSGISFSFMA